VEFHIIVQDMTCKVLDIVLSEHDPATTIINDIVH